MLSNEDSRQLELELNGSWAITHRWHGMRIAQRKRLAARPEFANCLDIVRSSDRNWAAMVQADIQKLKTDGIGLNPGFFVTGDDLITGQLTPGPRFKGILDEVRDAQLEGRVRSKEEAMELARRLSVKT